MNLSQAWLWWANHKSVNINQTSFPETADCCWCVCVSAEADPGGLWGFSNIIIWWSTQENDRNMQQRPRDHVWWILVSSLKIKQSRHCQQLKSSMKYLSMVRWKLSQSGLTGTGKRCEDKTRVMQHMSSSWLLLVFTRVQTHIYQECWTWFMWSCNFHESSRGFSRSIK